MNSFIGAAPLTSHFSPSGGGAHPVYYLWKVYPDHAVCKCCLILGKKLPQAYV